MNFPCLLPLALLGWQCFKQTVGETISREDVRQEKFDVTVGMHAHTCTCVHVFF